MFSPRLVCFLSISVIISGGYRFRQWHAYLLIEEMLALKSLKLLLEVSR